MKHLIVFLFFLTALSCTKDEIIEKKITRHKFIVAGHVYGNPNNHTYGIYQPFKQHFSRFNQDEDLKKVFFTGDVVFTPDSLHWDAFMNDYNNLNMPKYIAPGNHDRGTLYESIFQDYWSSFVYRDNLYIMLSPTDWNIETDQLTFLSQSLQNHSYVNNIFIFVHELIWWSPTNEYSGVDINYAPHYPGSNNYDSIIHPLLKSSNKPVYLFAGDLGANHVASPFMKASKDNVHYIASGMGGNIRDNIIEVSIFSNDSIDIKALDIHQGLSQINEFDNYELPL